MSNLNSEQISFEIANFLKRENPVLFAGAGVSSHAGLPIWNEYLLRLADFSERYDPLTAELIRKRTKDNHFTEAATVYKTCSEIPEGEKYRAIQEPLQNIPLCEELHSLVSLPFSSIITTNWDRSLHNAYARIYGKAPFTVELHDSTLANASFRTDFFIARIHGREDVPNEMVLDNNDYKELLSNTNYIDLVINMFTRCSCLFLGFSFFDPAIQSVLSLVKRRLSPTFPKLHLALLPDKSDPELVDHLTQLNIEVKLYAPNSEHGILWDGISLLAENLNKNRKTDLNHPIDEKQKLSFPMEGIKKYIAAAYSRMQITDSEYHEIIPLRDIAVDGIIIGLYSENNKSQMKYDDLRLNLKRYLNMPEEEISVIFERRIEALINRHYLDQVADELILLKMPERNLSSHLSDLVKGTLNRLQVREGYKISSVISDLVEKVIENVLVIRSWDLGACFAGATNLEIPNVLNTIQDQIKKIDVSSITIDKDKITRSIFDLFNRPNEKESELLGDLGRAAFALQLITNNPCSVFAYSDVLPDRIYLDASVLMPAIVEGHPYSIIYRDAIIRLNKAMQTLGKSLSIYVIRDFLDEIISHRRIALREVNELGLYNSTNLEQYIGLYGSENANVFIAAFASRVGRVKEQISFDDFLMEIAPYTTVDQLEDFLLKKEGIKTIRLGFSSPEELTQAETINKRLHIAYAEDKKPQEDSKGMVLIDDEANQLTILAIDLEKDIKAIFVTADQRLRRLAPRVLPGKLSSAIISHRNLVQLIDLILGVKTDPISISRLIWSSGFDDQTMTIHTYFTDIALRHYNEAYAMALPDVLKELSEKVESSAKLQGINLWSKSTSEKASASRFLDRFENEFYAEMAKVIEKKTPEESENMKLIRIHFLEEKIRTIKEKIKYLENTSKTLKRPDVIKILTNEIKENEILLNHFSIELRNIRRE